MNCERREVYTVHVNSQNVTSPQNDSEFTTFIDIPLRNVVKAELLLASISVDSNAAGVIHLYVEELVSKFNQRSGVTTRITGSGLNTVIGDSTGTQSNVGFINNAFATLPLDSSAAQNPNVGRLIYNKFSNFPTDQEYIEPIRQLNKLTIKLFNPNGNQTGTNATTFLTFRFECAKDNVCLY